MPWVLDLTSGYHLRDPRGRAVPLPYRSVARLLEALVRSGAEPLNREAVAEALWPDASPAKRQVNLRQALYRLKTTIGAEYVVSSSEACWLSRAFTIQIIEPVDEEQAEDTNGSPIAGFVNVLRWFSERDPLQMLDIMRANMDLSLGIWPVDVRSLLSAASVRLPINHRLHGWTAFWRGYEASLAHDIVRGRTLFGAALHQAMEDRDYPLAAESLLFLGASDILLSNLKSASTVAERGAQLSASTSDPTLRSKVDQLRGTILIHQARTAEGLQLLELASAANTHRLFDHAQSEALRALYSACAGHTSDALRLLEHPQAIAKETRHFRLESTCMLADAYVRLAEEDWQGASDRLDKLIHAADRRKVQHIVIYGREAKAVALLRMGDRQGASHELAGSRTTRDSVKMSYTAWDRLRLKPFVRSENDSAKHLEA